MLRLILAGAVVLGLVLAVALYIHSKGAVIDEMIAAAHRGDAPALAARIDWEDLRASLKHDLAAQKKLLGGDQVGPPLSEVDKVVDYYVQPENIDIAFYFREQIFKDIPEQDFIDSTGFAPPWGFYMILGWPRSVPGGEIPAVLLERMKARLTFRLDGLTWKVKQMYVPLFMVPTGAYTEPAVKVFGRAPH